tara:strand:- start:2277 stop:2834 length:558 start_codon:yes stop_codon:yes gene_type:complete
MIVQNDGAEKLTTQRIADIAGVNIASLYQYFPSKEAVLARVFETEIERMAEAAKSEFKRIEALSYQSFEGTLVAIIQLEASQLSRIHGLGSDFYLRYRQSFDIHERVNQLALSQSNLSWESWFVNFLRRHRQCLRGDNVHQMSFLARNTLQSCLIAALVENPPLLAQADFLEELRVLVLRYLQAD